MLNIKKNLDVTVELLERIIKDNNLTQVAFANSLGKSKQFIWQILNGKRNITVDTVKLVKQTYPEYFDVSYSVKIRFCDDITLSYANSLESKSNSYICFDKRLLPQISGKEINPDECKVVTVGFDLEPEYKHTDKVIVCTSYGSFLNNELFVFIINGICYLRKITILPDNKVKCASLNDKEDTFYINENDGNLKVLGLVVPRIRL